MGCQCSKPLICKEDPSQKGKHCSPEQIADCHGDEKDHTCGDDTSCKGC